MAGKGCQMAARILVVDDERQIRELLARFLAREGYEVVLASNGEEAIKLVESEDPQVILLDVKMPGTDGIEMCKKLKAEEKTSFIPVIIMTALSDRKTEAVEARADDFVDKPFNLAELLVRVKSILRVGHFTDPVKRLKAYMEERDRNLFKQR